MNFAGPTIYRPYADWYLSIGFKIFDNFLDVCKTWATPSREEDLGISERE